MISDNPDEDADKLDDETLLISYLEAGSSRSEPEAGSAIADWPPRMLQDLGLGLNVDVETLKWFQSNYTDWRQGMCSVLRAWVDIQMRGQPTPPSQNLHQHGGRL